MKAKKIAIVLIILSCAAGSGAYFFHAGKNKRIIYTHRNEHHPVINELFAGRIEQGQSVNKLLYRWFPTEYSGHDTFKTLYYSKTDAEAEPCCWDYSYCVEIISMNGRLIKALAVEGVLSGVEYVFFDGMDKETDEEYWSSRLKYASEKNNNELISD